LNLILLDNQNIERKTNDFGKRTQLSKPQIANVSLFATGTQVKKLLATSCGHGARDWTPSLYASDIFQFTNTSTFKGAFEN